MGGRRESRASARMFPELLDSSLLDSLLRHGGMARPPRTTAPVLPSPTRRTAPDFTGTRGCPSPEPPRRRPLPHLHRPAASPRSSARQARRIPRKRPARRGRRPAGHTRFVPREGTNVPAVRTEDIDGTPFGPGILAAPLDPQTRRPMWPRLLSPLGFRGRNSRSAAAFRSAAIPLRAAFRHRCAEFRRPGRLRIPGLPLVELPQFPVDHGPTNAVGDHLRMDRTGATTSVTWPSGAASLMA